VETAWRKRLPKAHYQNEIKKVRLKKSWNGNITAWTTIKPEQLMQQVEEHPEWRQNVANPQTEDG